jgi:hypothetical protein
VLREGAHSAEFILTEANGERSRDNAYLAGAVSIAVGQPLQRTAAATTDQPATFVPATTGANCNALAIYAGTGDATAGLRISVISRDAEVNGKLLFWGTMSGTEIAAGIATLRAAGIVVRDTN